jgi:YHS domain-containing protein
MVGVLAIIRGHAQVLEGVEEDQQNTAHEVARGTRVKSGANEPGTPAEERFVNPVCGTAVSIADAMHVENFQGESYYFCCDECWTTFIKDPQKYAAIQQLRSVIDQEDTQPPG